MSEKLKFSLLIIGCGLIIFFKDNPVLDILFLIIITIFSGWTLVKRYQENETFKKKNALTLEHTNDNHRQVFSWMIGGGGIILNIYWLYKGYSFDWHSLFSFLITLFIFLSGVLFPKSVFYGKKSALFLLKIMVKRLNFL